MLAENTKITKPNQSSEKMLILMEILSKLDEPARLQDIARQASMNPSTTLRFLSTLQRNGYAAQDIDTGRYFLTFKICDIANSIRSNVGIRNVSLPYMRHLSRVFREGVELSIEGDLAVVCLESINSVEQKKLLPQRTGKSTPLHCTGAGKLFLLNYSSQQLDKYVTLDGLQRFTPRTISNRAELTRELEKVRSQGYAMDNEECEQGMRGISTPIRDYTGAVIAALTVSGPTTRFSEQQIFDNLHYLLTASSRISSLLGHQAITVQ